MNIFYFTFGSDHNLNDGTRMMNRYVTVYAEDHRIARQQFIDLFSSIYNETPLSWAFQYNEGEYNPKLWANEGEYAFIKGGELTIN